MSEEALKTPAPETKRRGIGPTAKNTLVSMTVLIIIASAAVLLLALADAFFPKYVPKLDLETVTILNGMAPTGEPDNQKALGEGYFVMATPADLDAWNQANGTNVKKVTAVYKAVKGDSAGAVFVETSTYKNGSSEEILMIVALNGDGTYIKLHIEKIMVDSYYDPADLDKINAFIAGKKAGEVLASDLRPLMVQGTVTRTPNGFANALEMAAKMFAEVSAVDAEVPANG